MLRNYVLHSSYLGIVCMKLIARLHVWWPHIDAEIKSCTKECLPCQANHRNSSRAPPHLWEQASKPWERLHLDFAGPFHGHMWFILVDAFSKLPEVVQLSTTTATKIVTVLRTILGIPNEIGTDNGPQFTATKFEEFCKNNGINHTLTAPYHPSSKLMEKLNVLCKLLRQQCKRRREKYS